MQWPVILWEENVGKLQQQSSYTLKDIMIREYACSRFLGLGQDGSEMKPLTDIGVVKQVDGSAEKLEELCEARVIAVVQLEVYQACLPCKAHVKPQLPSFGRCSKPGCEMMQQYEECTEQILAKVMFKRASGSTLTLSAFNEVVKKLANVDEDTTMSEADLMSAPPC